MMRIQDVQVQIDITFQMHENGVWDKQKAFKYLADTRKIIMCLGRSDQNEKVDQMLKKALLELNPEASI